MIRKYLALRTPDMEYYSFIDIPLNSETFKDKFLLIDVDNTIALKGELRVSNRVFRDLHRIRQSGWIKGYCLLSNVVTRSQKRIDRVKSIAYQLDCPYVCAFWPDIKPKPAPYQEALGKVGVEASGAVMIGDQLLTDILGANKLGIKTVLIRPMGKDGWYTLPRRWLEKVVVYLRDFL